MYVINDDGIIDIIRGDSAEFDIVVYQLDEHGEPVEYQLQPGDVVRFTVKKSTKAPEKLIQKVGPHISILPEDTSELAYKTYKYDVEITLADGFVDTIIPPTDFVIHDEVTW